MKAHQLLRATLVATEWTSRKERQLCHRSLKESFAIMKKAARGFAPVGVVESHEADNGGLEGLAFA
jgi:hypothetical protein